MGLFDFLRDPEKLERKKRPHMPQELMEHYNLECEAVMSTIYHQDVLDGIREKTVEVVVSREEGERGYDVALVDGTVVGVLATEQVARIRMDGDRVAVAEVQRPVYMNVDHVELYVPLSDAALEEDAAERERRQKMDELTIWVNLDASKWEGPRFDSGSLRYDDADFVVTERKGAKPLLSVTCGGATLMTFNARMKPYRDLMERSEHHIRVLVIEPREGEYGPYYRVGFYF